MNIVVDDGTDNIRCVLWREQVDQLLGIPKQELLAFKDAPSTFEPYKNELLGVVAKIRGRVKKNDAFGRIELVAYEIVPNVDPEGNPEKPTQPTTEKSEPKPTAEIVDPVTTPSAAVEEKEETTTAVVDDDTQEVESISTDVKETFNADDGAVAKEAGISDMSLDSSDVTLEEPQPSEEKSEEEKKKQGDDDILSLDDLEDLDDLE